jgi:hypothetical protein
VNSNARQRKKTRARWRRNKRDERARKKPPPAPPPSNAFVAQVVAERDRRRADYPGWLWICPQWHGGRGSYEFQTDVWAARSILAKQFGRSNVTAGKIARWLSAHGLEHGYKPNSLRTMVYRAIDAIEIMETYTTSRRSAPHWLTFPQED